MFIYLEDDWKGNKKTILLSLQAIDSIELEGEEDDNAQPGNQ